MKDIERIQGLCLSWSERLEAKNAYLAGEKEIRLEEFAELFRESFEVFRRAKHCYIYKGESPKRRDVVFEYLRLLTLTAEYGSIADVAGDKSADRACTVTSMVAKRLAEYAFTAEMDPDNGHEIEYRDAGTEKHGDFDLYVCDYPFLCDDRDDDSLVIYNVYDGDLSAIFELVNCSDRA